MLFYVFLTLWLHFLSASQAAAPVSVELMATGDHYVELKWSSPTVPETALPTSYVVQLQQGSGPWITKVCLLLWQ